MQAFAAGGGFRRKVALATSAGLWTGKRLKKRPGEVIGLYSTGPAGGGGVRKSVVGRVRTMSALVERGIVDTRVRILPEDGDGDGR